MDAEGFGITCELSIWSMKIYGIELKNAFWK